MTNTQSRRFLYIVLECGLVFTASNVEIFKTFPLHYYFCNCICSLTATACKTFVPCKFLFIVPLILRLIMTFSSRLSDYEILDAVNIILVMNVCNSSQRRTLYTRKTLSTWASAKITPRSPTKNKGRASDKPTPHSHQKSKSWASDKTSDKERTKSTAPLLEI